MKLSEQVYINLVLTISTCTQYYRPYASTVYDNDNADGDNDYYDDDNDNHKLLCR